MFVELFIAFTLGIFAGTFTGLFPGIHINLISTILTSSLTLTQKITPNAFIVFIVSMSITHTFLDFIPSIYLGAPEEDSFLSILPGHKLLQEGLGHQAIILTLYGSISALIVVIPIIPLYILFLEQIFNFSKMIIPFILIFVSIYMILREKKFILGFTVFILSGILGYLAFNLTVEQPLLPLLSGLFGISSLIVSIKSKIKIPKQNIQKLREIKIPKITILELLLSSSIISTLFSFLPAIGSGQSTFISSELTKSDPKSFLFITGIINSTIMILSFITLFVINRSRTGSAAAINEIITEFNWSHLSIILITVILSSLISFFLGIKISKIFAKNISKINYSILSSIIIVLIFIISIVFSNFLGMIVLITSTFLGLFCILSGSRRINLLGCLILPTIIYYLS